MIEYLQKNYNLKRVDTSQKAELEKLREQVQEYRKKYNTEDNEMDLSSESDSVPDLEEQKKNRRRIEKTPTKKKE